MESYYSWRLCEFCEYYNVHCLCKFIRSKTHLQMKWLRLLIALLVASSANAEDDYVKQYRAGSVSSVYVF